MSKHRKLVPVHSGSEDFRDFCDHIASDLRELFGCFSYLDELNDVELADRDEQSLIFIAGMEAAVCELLATIATEGSSEFIATLQVSSFLTLPTELTAMLDVVRKRAPVLTGNNHDRAWAAQWKV